MAITLASGAEIKKIRKTMGLTQKNLAERSGVSQSLIARIEAGSVDSRLSTLNKILSALTVLQEKRTAADVMHAPVITVETKDSVRRAVELMEKHGISQMPVLENGRVTGNVQEATLMRRILQSREPEKIFNLTLENVMENSFPIVSLSAEIEEVLGFLSHDQPAILVMDKGLLIGIITKIDIISSARTRKSVVT